MGVEVQGKTRFTIVSVDLNVAHTFTTNTRIKHEVQLERMTPDSHRECLFTRMDRLS